MALSALPRFCPVRTAPGPYGWQIRSTQHESLQYRTLEVAPIGGCVTDVGQAQALLNSGFVKNSSLSQEYLCLAVPSSVIEPLWIQFKALIPPVQDEHPLGCHRPRVPDRVVFDKLVQVLVLGAAYEKIADSSCSATTIRRRRDEWITAGIFTDLEHLKLDAYDRYCGVKLEDLIVDGSLVKAPCGGEAAGRSPVWIAANRARSAPCSPRVQGSPSEPSWQGPIATTRPCYVLPWNG